MADSKVRPDRAEISSPLACSEWARSQRLDPVGTAGQYEGFLLVEQPLPWPSDVSDIPALAEVAKIAASAGLRLQAVVAVNGGEPDEPFQRPGPAEPLDGASDNGFDGHRRLICYRSVRPGWAGPLARSELLCPPSAVTEGAEALVAATPTSAESEVTAAHQREVIDVLVCTHGRRDTCCGGRGMDLLGALTDGQVFGPSANVRLWRTSHTGGHRFAPTSIALPSGTLWAWADARLIASVVSTEGRVEDVLDRYRGCATIGSPAQQAVERAVLAEVGWSLLGSWRRASDLGPGRVRLETELAGTWEASVREGRHVPQPDCRTLPELATKQGVEWVVDELRRA